MARQQDRQKARAMKKKMLDESRAATPIPTMKVPRLGQKPELKDFAQAVAEVHASRLARQDQRVGGDP